MRKRERKIIIKKDVRSSPRVVVEVVLSESTIQRRKMVMVMRVMERRLSRAGCA